MDYSVKFETIRAGDVAIRVAVAGEGPLVLYVHGFPESWYSWRHQIKPTVDAGFKFAAVDVTGYGGSDNPHPVERYSMENLTRDIANVARAMSPDKKVIIVGHDWGAPISWNTALLYPDTVKAVGCMSVPYTPPGDRMFLDVIHDIFTRRGKFFYQVYFQEEGVAEAELEANTRDSLRRFYYALSGDAPEGTWPLDKVDGDPLLYRLPDPDPFPAWMSEEVLDYYEAEFRKSGFRGPLNRYRNHQRDFDFLSALPDKKIYQPALFIGGTSDLAIKIMPNFDPMEAMAPHVPNLEVGVMLEGCGHWTQQERPDEVNEHLIPWLKAQ